MQQPHKRWASLLLCGLLCALLLSGCSDVLQALADGTDAVLGGLADLTDTALDAAADATDDTVKDAILDAYGSLVDTAGSWALTPDRSLQGERIPGKDDYTGTYAAGYEDFSGTELLFGGTTLDRESGDTGGGHLLSRHRGGEGRHLPELRLGGPGDPAVRKRGLLWHHRGGRRQRLSRCLGRGRDRERVHSVTIAQFLRRSKLLARLLVYVHPPPVYPMSTQRSPLRCKALRAFGVLISAHLST